MSEADAAHNREGARARPKRARANYSFTAERQRAAGDGAASQTMLGGPAGGASLAVFGGLVGLFSGLALFFISERWINGANAPPLAMTALFFTSAWGASSLLVAGPRTRWAALIAGAAIAALLTPSAYWMSIRASAENTYDTGPIIFWFSIGAPISLFVLATLAKSALHDGAPPRYRNIFLHGLTLPLIAACGGVFALLLLLLLFAWSGLLAGAGVHVFRRVFTDVYFVLPFLGLVTGASMAIISGQHAILGALRYILLLFSRLAAPVLSVLLTTLIFVIAINRSTVAVDAIDPAAFLGLTFFGMLIFNGVYQDGEAGPPALWLRLSTIAIALCLPVFAFFGAMAFLARMNQPGFGVDGLIALGVSAWALAYGIVCFAGVLSEINWRARRWMAPVGALNPVFALLWIALLVALASPLLDPWKLAARHLETRLMAMEIDAADFPYGYVQRGLGRPGAATLARLRAADHPQADIIRRQIAMLDDNSPPPGNKPGGDRPGEPRAAPRQPTSEVLEFNPPDNPDRPQESDNRSEI